MKAGGQAGLANLLYSESFNLQVSPRRRLFAGAVPTVPATTTQSFPFSLPQLPDAATLANPRGLKNGDGILIDFAMITLQANAAGLVLLGASLQLILAPSGITPIPIGQPLSTLNALGFSVAGAQVEATQFSPSPPLLSVVDLNALGFQLGGDLAPGVVITPQVTITLQNTTAAAVSANLNMYFWYRYVQGLQEA